MLDRSRAYSGSLEHTHQREGAAPVHLVPGIVVVDVDVDFLLAVDFGCLGMELFVDSEDAWGVGVGVVDGWMSEVDPGGTAPGMVLLWCHDVAEDLAAEFEWEIQEESELWDDVVLLGRCSDVGVGFAVSRYQGLRVSYAGFGYVS